jgi:SIT4-associating protein SAP185/190
MNKRNAAAAAAAANGDGSSAAEGSSDAPGDGSRLGGLNTPSANQRPRNPNPFADYEDEDDENGSGSDDGESVERGDGDSTTMNMSSWWRGMVRSASRKRSADDYAAETEKFGDGRDDSSDDSDDGRGRRGDDDDMEDEEFGDFAMPEAVSAAPSAPATGGFVSGIDPARERILVKPLAVHPPTGSLKSSVSPFSGLWPFSSPGFGGSKGKGEDEAGAGPAGSATGAVEITEEPVELGKEEEDAMISEDGSRIDRAVEAKRRTSIEDPDEDELDVGEEIIVHRAAGV